MLGGRVHCAARPYRVARDRRNVDDVATLRRLHVRKRGSNAVEHPLDIDIDHAFPVSNLATLERRVGHQTRIVDEHVDTAV